MNDAQIVKITKGLVWCVLNDPEKVPDKVNLLMRSLYPNLPDEARDSMVSTLVDKLGSGRPSE